MDRNDLEEPHEGKSQHWWCFYYESVEALREGMMAPKWVCQYMLGVAEGATEEQIDVAYQRLVSIVCPCYKRTCQRIRTGYKRAYHILKGVL